MHGCAYNAIRLLILHSAMSSGRELGRISFKGALAMLREWLPRAGEYAEKPRKLAQWREELRAAISSVTNPHRPERQEPRTKKRRPKSHQLLTKPRHEFQEIPHHEKYRKPLNQVPFMPPVIPGIFSKDADEMQGKTSWVLPLIFNETPPENHARFRPKHALIQCHSTLTPFPSRSDAAKSGCFFAEKAAASLESAQ